MKSKQKQTLDLFVFWMQRTGAPIRLHDSHLVGEMNLWLSVMEPDNGEMRLCNTDNMPLEI